MGPITDPPVCMEEPWQYWGLKKGLSVTPAPICLGWCSLSVLGGLGPGRIPSPLLV